jgi:hypothetical protein
VTQMTLPQRGVPVKPSGWRQRGPRVVAIKQIDLELGKAPAENASG